MNKILVPTDFSKESEYALETAAKLAKNFNAEIIALHMLDIPETILTKETSEEYPELLLFSKLAKQRFSDFLDKDYLGGITVTEAIQHHKAFEGIIDSAKKEDADIIIMGSHGVSGAKELFVGSNTEKVVRSSDIPVLVVKENQEDISFNKFVFASNFVEDCYEAFKKAKNFAKTINTKINLLYINTPKDFKNSTEIEKQVSLFLQKVETPADEISFAIHNDYDVEQGILNYCQKVNADLIGIPTHGRKGLAHIIKGSIGENVANHADIPVVTFKI
ncbi:universal stress protein [Pseudofulvibacter geojedonensis]|uniref:Universal stress protein n=1 Tax=Pseudofulvibacter geojedonensis TaxID=1123758 RepID=A0ABW3I245_9FLAO